MTFGEKIRNARKQKKLTQKQLAELIGAAHNSISDWENNKNKPDPDTIELICGTLDIAPNYLLGKEEDSISPCDKKFLSDFYSLDSQGQETVRYILDNEKKRCEKISELDSRIEELETKISEKIIPKRIWAYYGKVAAAGKSFGFDDIAAGTIEMPLTDENSNADYTIGVSGDSMEPTYYDGDIVYVQKVANLSIGDIGIFQKDNGIYIKEVGEKGLISHNSKYPPMISDSCVYCLGKVIGKIEE